MGTTPQKNSFVTIAEQISLFNANTAEIIAKLNDVVTSDKSVVNVNQKDEYGTEYTYSLPTVGKLQADITELNNNVKRLAGLNDNNVHIINGKSTKRIYLSDLNREPNMITSIDKVSSFGQTNNWFFESLMNPMLSVKFDLTNKVGNDVDGVISRRYIVKFEKDKNGYTTNGAAAKSDFENKFVGNNNIKLEEFIKWHTNPTNVGVVDNLIPIYDEQYFTFEYQDISDYGLFSVERQETDTINNKFWYHIYPYRYVSSNAQEKTLKVGDELMLNKQDSVSRWKIIEISNATSSFRIRLENIEGYDPIPTGKDVLRYYGNVNVNKEVKVTVGFDEYLVVFMKPTNSRNKIKGSLWSPGTGLYTNDLKLDTNTNISMSQFYLDTVYDYGTLIKDLIVKQIPSTFGVTPNAAYLNTNNFKVVQINQHLTDTNDAKEINDLHSQKNTYKTKLEQVNSAILQKNQDLSVKKYTSVSERDRDVAELAKLVKDQETFTTNLYSITTQIKSKTDTINKVDPIFRIRGFWDLPTAQKQSGYRDQEVIQFLVQYRYSAKNGTENQTEGYNLISTDNTTKTGYFSNWKEFKTDIRKRTYSETTGEWTWNVENVEDADTPNINQLDIPIMVGEKVEIRIKSISEVGFPDSIIMSDWSNILTVEFPENLNGIINQNEFILEEAKKDNIKSDFELTLSAKGVNKHLSDSFYVNEKYLAHQDNTIITNYKDLQGNSLDLRQYLEFLTKKVETLEGIINSAKGVLKVVVFDGHNEIEVKNNSENNISVILQDYGVSKDGIYYDNKVSKISDYYIKIDNLSHASTLKFLVSESYTPNTVIRQNDEDNLTSLVDIDNNFVIQQNNQWVYFCDTYKNEDLYLGNLLHSDSGYTYDTEFKTNISVAASSVNNNLGLSKDFMNLSKNNSLYYPATGKIIDYPSIGKQNEWFVGPDKMGTIVAPMVKTINDLMTSNGTSLEITNQESVIIPINIYWLFRMNNNLTKVELSKETQTEHNKSIRVRMNPTSISGTFDFVVTFNIQNKKI